MLDLEDQDANTAFGEVTEMHSSMARRSRDGARDGIQICGRRADRAHGVDGRDGINRERGYC